MTDEAETTPEIRIAPRGRPAAESMSTDDVESLHETSFWSSTPGIQHSLAEAEAEYSRGETLSGQDLRAEFGLPEH